MARTEDQTWGSLQRREKGRAMLADGPVQRPADWVESVNEPQAKKEVEALRRSINRGCPYGEDAWHKAMVEKSGLEWTLRPRKAAMERAN